MFAFKSNLKKKKKKAQNRAGLVSERNGALAKLSLLLPRSPGHYWEVVGELATEMGRSRRHSER